jgi:hypothetical protein
VSVTVPALGYSTAPGQTSRPEESTTDTFGRNASPWLMTQLVDGAVWTWR